MAIRSDGRYRALRVEIPKSLTSTADLVPLFEATVQATEEAIINALVAARTLVGRDDHKVIGLPHDALRAALKKYNRLAEPASGAKGE